MSDTEVKYFVRAFLRFVKQQIADRRISPDTVESLEVAAQCLETAYDLQPSTDDGAVSTDQSAGSSDTPDTHPLAHVNLFELFYNSCSKVSAEAKLESENIKNEGNCLMREEKYHEALNAYNRAISLDATNPVFYCNRAAAYSKLGDYERAADDCKMSLRYDPSYSKAYGRLGFAYSKLNKYDKAIEALKNACRLDPDNEDYKSNLSLTQQKFEESLSTSSANVLNQSPAINRLLQDFATAMPDLGISGPSLMNLAQVILRDPGVQNLISTIQSPAGGVENIAGLQNILSQVNPELVNLLSERMRAGQDNGDNPPNNNSNAPPQ